MFRALWFDRHSASVRHSENAEISSLVLSAVPNDAVIPRPGHEYGDQLLDDDYLASLRWRDHDELLQPDGGTLRTELPGWRCGISRGYCLHPRTC
jgi:hypothetical protein